MKKYKPVGTYNPEMVTLKEIAEYEKKRTGKNIEPGTLNRQATREFILKWRAKNPKLPLTEYIDGEYVKTP